MAAFDPSIISQIPEGAPDPIAARGKAIQLKDLADTQQFNALRLGELRRDQADEQKARDILKGSKFDTQKGVYETMEKLSQAGLQKKALEFGSLAQKYQSGEIERQQQELELQSKQHDMLAGTLDQVYGQLEQMREQGATPAQLDAAAVALSMPAMQNLVKQAPGLANAVQQFAQNPQNLSYNGIKSAEAQSNEGQRLLKERRDEFNAQTQRKREEETERKDRASESLADRKQRAADEKTKQGAFGEDERDLLAELAVRNVNLPAGLRSQAQIKATLQGLREKNPNKTPGEIADDIKSGKLKLSAETRGAQVAGTQIGKVALASNELETFGDQVIEASKAVPRGVFGQGKSLTINGLIQAGEKEVSDPNLLRLKAKLQALENAYEQLSSRGGIDKDKRDRIASLFDSRLSDQGVQSLVKALKEEAAGAGQAATKTIAETSGTAIPGAGRGSAPQAEPTATGPNGQKIVLRNGQWVPLGQ